MPGTAEPATTMSGPATSGGGFPLDVDPGRETDGGVPVGRADTEADRVGSAEGDERA